MENGLVGFSLRKGAYFELSDKGKKFFLVESIKMY